MLLRQWTSLGAETPALLRGGGKSGSISTHMATEKQTKFAVIMTGGKQYQVAEGDTISVEKLGVAEGDSVVFDKVMLVEDGSTTQIGAPFLEGASVEAKVISEKKGKKVVGANYKAKSNRRTKYGHRQTLTKVSIGKIS